MCQCSGTLALRNLSCSVQRQDLPLHRCRKVEPRHFPPEVIRRKVRVPLGHLDGRIPQQLLNGVERDPAHDRVRRERVSLAAQTENVRAYCSLYDIKLLEIIEDPGASAKTLDRPGLQRVLAALRKGEVQGLVVAKLDRLTRSVADMAALIDSYFGERAGRSSAAALSASA